MALLLPKYLLLVTFGLYKNRGKVYDVSLPPHTSPASNPVQLKGFSGFLSYVSLQQ